MQTTKTALSAKMTKIMGGNFLALKNAHRTLREETFDVVTTNTRIMSVMF